MRSLVWATALVVTSSFAVAQPQPQPVVKDGKRTVPIELHVDKRVAQPQPEVKDGKQVFAITLSPMAAPKPLSNYYLTPQYQEQQPGDQLSGFMKCFMEHANFFNAENEAKRQKLLDMSLADLSPRDVDGFGIRDGIAYQPKYATLMCNVDLAARYSRTEWNEYFVFRKDGINTILPELQSLRRLANVLHLRLRVEIKNGEFDRAMVTVKSLTGLARMLESHPTIIGGMVGFAVQATAWDGVEEMIAQPGCPNLFWSLVELPNPPFNTARGFEGDRVFTTQLDHLLMNNRAMTDREIDEVIQFAEEQVKIEQRAMGRLDSILTVRVRAGLMAADKARVEAGRARLVTDGKLSASAVKTFPALQVVLADNVLTCRTLADEAMKYRNLPYHEAIVLMGTAEKKFQDEAKYPILPIIFSPLITKSKVAEARNAQRVALLRILEALRLHGAASNGELPATLADTKLPMPLDAATGKAFDYAVKGGVATLSGGKIADQPLRVYEVRLRK